MQLKSIKVRDVASSFNFLSSINNELLREKNIK